MNRSLALLLASTLASALLLGCSDASPSASTSDASADGAPAAAHGGGCADAAFPDDYCATGSLGCADDTASPATCVDGHWVCQTGVLWSSCGPCRGQSPSCCGGATQLGPATCDPDAGWTCANVAAPADAGDAGVAFCGH